jgi:hypothetical protein
MFLRHLSKFHVLRETLTKSLRLLLSTHLGETKLQARKSRGLSRLSITSSTSSWGNCFDIAGWRSIGECSRDLPRTRGSGPSGLSTGPLPDRVGYRLSGGPVFRFRETDHAETGCPFLRPLSPARLHQRSIAQRSHGMDIKC